MTLTYTSVVQAPLEEVFAWHERPGAIRRLTPPWPPVTVEREAGSLRDGQAVLRMPGGVRWVAAHRPEAYDPPRKFADELVSRPLSSVLNWRHTHVFTAEGPGATRITDRVDTTAPARALRAMFSYRQHQLTADLAAIKRARAWHDGPLTIAVTGASGLIGAALAALAGTSGHDVIHLVRHAPQNQAERRWNPDDPAPDLLDGVDALVHLAGASIAGRFTEEHKERIAASRIGPTRKLAELAAARAPQLRAFVTASAIGYYGPDRGDEVLTEQSQRGAGFLADVVADWEAAAAPAQAAGLRTVAVRTGIVQTPAGGVLKLLGPLFQAGLGGKLGTGEQWQSWISLDDLTDIYLRAVLDESLSGPVNAVAPEPVRNSAYTAVLAGVLRRPALLPVPSLGPRLLLGAEGAREFAEASQNVTPQRLAQAGHVFRYRSLEQALRHLYSRE